MMNQVLIASGLALMVLIGVPVIAIVRHTFMTLKTVSR